MNDPEAIDELLEDLPNLATTEELAELMRVKPQTVLKWTKDNGLKSITVGARVRRFRKADIRSFLVMGDEINDSGPPAHGEEHENT
jgi:excisionase family DNA binding protein